MPTIRRRAARAGAVGAGRGERSGRHLWRTSPLAASGTALSPGHPAPGTGPPGATCLARPIRCLGPTARGRFGGNRAVAETDGHGHTAGGSGDGLMPTLRY
jgi:hypothetical protein